MKTSTSVGWALPRQFVHLLGPNRSLHDGTNDGQILIRIRGIQGGKPYANLFWNVPEQMPASKYRPHGYQYPRIQMRALLTADPDGACKYKWPRWYTNNKAFHGRPLHVSVRGFLDQSELAQVTEAINLANEFLTELAAKTLVRK